LRTREVTLRADYTHGNEASPSAYAQLLLDVLEGDPAPFLRFDEVEWAWEVLDPVLIAWRSGKPELYRSGEDGPRSQHSILEPGHEWRSLDA
jgi:glucose-6-phosphate 1-dehydrogenase